MKKSKINSAHGSKVDIYVPELYYFEGKIEKITEHSIIFLYGKKRSPMCYRREISLKDPSFVYAGYKSSFSKTDFVAMILPKQHETSIGGEIVWHDNHAVITDEEGGEIIFNPKFAEILTEIEPSERIKVGKKKKHDDEKPLKKKKKFGNTKIRESDDKW